ncbi:MAG: hypothetical protein KBT01_03745 [Clostridiales bacterium]|nr:hypothetical protein [Candidatus Blautia equi]
MALLNISIQELTQLMEENRRNFERLLQLLEESGADVEKYKIPAGNDGEEEADLSIHISPTNMTADGRRKWDLLETMLEEEIEDYRENAEELQSMKYLCRTEDEYADMAQEVQASKDLINGLHKAIEGLQRRDQIRRGESVK